MPTLSSLALNPSTFSLTLDSSGNIAVLTGAAAMAQDAACAIQEYLGENYWDVTQGVDWLGRILGVNPPPSLALLKQLLQAPAVASNANIAAAQIFISSFNNRSITGQVQVVSVTGETGVANFSVVNPQGAG
jgi:hypothetical protein